MVRARGFPLIYKFNLIYEEKLTGYSASKIVQQVMGFRKGIKSRVKFSIFTM